MANRISVTSQPLALSGVAVALTAPTVDGDVIDAGQTFLMVDNASGSSITVTALSPRTVDGVLTVGPLAVAVGAGVTKLIGPFNGSTFGQLSGANASGGNDQGRVYVNYSAIASVTRAVVSY